ncbi:Retrovirus-related Pol polyprotein from transposon RE1 [Vitis vinifera]|uniref:Retrovirus-related Pol polyprotein from transposon RE1 n=1 Tax=Vitis vinifera TaxID=29760 RepID=A0A438FQZ2_VITVI|nr:Retrovirus-related Pol polyprotein from transposon RE1 [Vitis vinifera]
MVSELLWLHCMPAFSFNDPQSLPSPENNRILWLLQHKPPQIIVAEKDQVLQLLGGLRADYNSIVASLTAREDDISLHLVHNILLIHEQRLNLQTSITEDENTSQGRGCSSGRGQDPRYSHTGNRPQCQLCGKFSHTIMTCNHWFDIHFQGPDSQPTQLSRPPSNITTNNMQAMVASPSSSINDSWFMDTGATHHLSQTLDNLSHKIPYQGNDKVAIGDGKQLSIAHIGSLHFHTPQKLFHLHKVLHVPDLTSNLF